MRRSAAPGSGDPARLAAHALLLLAMAAPATADAAWVREEVRVKLREGAPTGSAVIGVVKTGDEVAILERGANWIRIRTEDGREGFIPNGFLQSDVPAVVRLEEVEAKLARIAREHEEVAQQGGRLQAQNAELARRDTEQRAQIERLEQETRELEAAERWPYMITGAAILGFGMLIGATVQAMIGGRRRRRRITF
ncbi:MAG: TIGR04211 family SH3 domain-containing protein [Deltaproteobacteria bacterium]|nr:MAG: TIGR04211 family SH3 domain-containing protein [Deltaproteobacteria bacterium]